MKLYITTIALSICLAIVPVSAQILNDNGNLNRNDDLNRNMNINNNSGSQNLNSNFNNSNINNNNINNINRENWNGNNNTFYNNNDFDYRKSNTNTNDFTPRPGMGPEGGPPGGPQSDAADHNAVQETWLAKASAEMNMLWAWMGLIAVVAFVGLIGKYGNSSDVP